MIKTLRKLVLGETWTLPIGVAVSVGVAGLLRAVAGDDGWWSEGGGFVLLALILAALLAAVGRPGRTRD
jgi:hypothetical protein